MIPGFVYVLCVLTSVLSAALLLRGSRRAGRLLFWSGMAFLLFSVGNALLFVDLVVVPQYDLLLMRNISTLIGICLLMYGLIWETD